MIVLQKDYNSRCINKNYNNINDRDAKKGGILCIHLKNFEITYLPLEDS